MKWHQWGFSYTFQIKKHCKESPWLLYNVAQALHPLHTQCVHIHSVLCIVWILYDRPRAKMASIQSFSERFVCCAVVLRNLVKCLRMCTDFMPCTTNLLSNRKKYSSVLRFTGLLLELLLLLSYIESIELHNHVYNVHVAPLWCLYSIH